MKKIYHSLYQKLRTLYHRVFERDFLRRIVRNSSYLVSASVFSAAMGMIQNIFMFRILGLAGTGLFAAMETFTNVINRLTSFRIHEFVVRYVRQYEEQNKQEKAAAVFKLAGMFELLGGLVAFSLIYFLAPLGVRLFSDQPDTEQWFILYGTLILFNIVFESSDGLLQVFDRFRDKALIDIVTSIVRVAATVFVFFTGGGFFEFIIAELTGRLLRAIAITTWSFVQAGRHWGAGWWKVSIKTLAEERNQLMKFAFSTNLSGTISLVAKDSESLWVNAFLGNIAGGYYKVALSLIGLLQLPISPLPATTYPELSRAAAQKDWAAARVILRRGSLMAMLYSLPVTIAIIIFGKWGITLYATADSLPAYIPLVILAIGYTVANTFYWNRAALLAFDRPIYPTVVNFIGMVFKVIGIFLFAEKFGATAFAVLLAGYYIFTVGLAALRVWMDVNKNLSAETQSVS